MGSLLSGNNPAASQGSMPVAGYPYAMRAYPQRPVSVPNVPAYSMGYPIQDGTTVATPGFNVFTGLLESFTGGSQVQY